MYLKPRLVNHIQGDDSKYIVCYNRNKPKYSTLKPVSITYGSRHQMNIYPLMIYTMGIFEIIKDGMKIKFSRKSPRKPLTMLKALIALGGKNVLSLKISNELWPDADGIAAHNAFTTTLRRLRQLIGIDKAIVLQEGCLSLDPRYCWVDIWEFRTLLDQIDETAIERDKDRYVTTLEKAIRMYRGDFLMNDTIEQWAVSIRENLRTKYIRSILKLGRHWETAGQYEEAMVYYNKGLEVYDLVEDLYQRLMICNFRIGCNADVIGVYKKLEKVLSAAAGIVPSQKTKQIFESLVLKNKIL